MSMAASWLISENSRDSCSAGIIQMKISLQLFTVRKYSQRNLYDTLRKIFQIGYKSIEAARIGFDAKSAAVINRARQDFGLSVLSSQIKFSQLNDDFSQTLSFLHEVECGNAVISMLPLHYIFGGDEGLKRFAADMNALAKRYKNEGIRLAFHHHDFEFLKFGSKRGLDILLENTDPALVFFVSDTYWAQKGGMCPAALIRRLGKRAISIHLRDYTLLPPFFAAKPGDCRIGSGMLDIKEILTACTETGIEFISIEQDSKDPFNDIALSLGYVKSLAGMVEGSAEID
jgi:sugar phosphate isomerase/epimerase